jgi:hypothetical protein
MCEKSLSDLTHQLHESQERLKQKRQLWLKNNPRSVHFQENQKADKPLENQETGKQNARSPKDEIWAHAAERWDRDQRAANRNAMKPSATDPNGPQTQVGK